MQKDTLKIEGMSCGHCEIAVKDAIRTLPGIQKVKVSKRKKQAVVSYDEQVVNLDAMISAVTAIGYTASK